MVREGRHTASLGKVARRAGGKLTVDRLVDAIALALAVGKTTQGGAGQQTNAAWDNAGLVADDVTKQVAGHDDAVQGAGALHHQHGGGVDELVLELQLGELVLEQLGDGLPPQAARGQDVGLVETPDLGGGVLGQGQEGGQAGDALNFDLAVGLGVHREAAAVILLALAKVDAAGQLTHDDEVGAAADVGLERGAVDQGVRGEAAGPQVAVGAELLAQRENALLGADGGGGTPFWAANGAEDDGVGGLASSEGFVGEGRATGVDGGLDEGQPGVSLRLWIFGGGGRKRLTPPKRWFWRLKVPAEGLRASTLLRT